MTEGELEELREENARLRRELSRVHRDRHRWAAYGLFGVAAAALLFSVVLEGAREVLIAVGATGAFAGFLTLFVSPGRFLSFGVFRSVSTDLLRNEERLVEELGLRRKRLYVPLDAARPRVRLFVPWHRDPEVPGDEELRSLFVVPGDERGRGVSLRPSGLGMYREFRETTDPPEEPEQLAERLGEALVEQFELVDRFRVEVDREGCRADFGLDLEEDLEMMDRPEFSFLAVGLAWGLGETVSVEVLADIGRTDYLVSCSW